MVKVILRGFFGQNWLLDTNWRWRRVVLSCFMNEGVIWMREDDRKLKKNIFRGAWQILGSHWRREWGHGATPL
jgi:hypothetical protein